MPPKKSRIQINKLWFLALEIIGFGLSFYLFLVSASLVPTPPCVRNSIFACTSIIRGTFGHFGPFSVAAMGIAYFAIHLALTAGLRERTAQVTKALVVLGGVLFIAWLRALELIYIREICPWCWGVALVTLIHAGLTYTVVAPPLPRLRGAGITGLVFGGFIVLIGLVSVIELSLGLGKKLQAQETYISPGDETYSSKSSVPIAGPADTPVKSTKKSKATPTPVPKPKVTPAVTPSPTPTVTMSAVPPTPAATPATTPSTTSSSTPQPTAASETGSAFDPEPKVADSEEVRILRKRGWRHAANEQGVIKAVKAQPPVLLLAYDPHCSDCHRLITQVLDRDSMNSLHVTRICIQESMLNGQLNDMVKALPTIILFDEDGSILMTNVGSRISDKELVEKIRQALGKGKSN